ncbi:hypothetical protein [Planococcus rifietoensis]|uniref:hypothetical protein n=1 Tax=Planococcus rifietoensis TaxID=200991 RepID=UPI0012EDFF15|nr:hypothetical protein [Planococcus rifietoensis]
MAYKLSRHKSEKKKQIILGITLIVVVAPFLSWLVGGLYATFGSIETTGWAEIVYPMIIFPLIGLLGIGWLVKGVLKKKEAN